MLAGVVGLMAYGFIENHDSQHAVASTAPTTPPTPARASAPARVIHNYTFERDGEYGYEPLPTEEERQRGINALPLVMIRFFEASSQRLRWGEIDGEALTTFECDAACEVVEENTYLDGASKKSFMHVVPGTLIDGIVRDIKAGHLKVYMDRAPKS